MLEKNKHIAIVCNPQAGNGKALRVADRIAVILKEKQIPYSLFTTYWPQVWNDITQAWIVGGDGTLNYFINQYSEINIPLSIFEGGTGNDFHELLYSNIRVELQIEKVLHGSTHRIDAGICNQKLFLNGVGIGFDGAIVKDLRNKTKKPGKASYLASVLKNIFIYRGVDHAIKFNGQTVSEKILMINIANGKTEGGGFRITPGAVVDDGKLDINILKEIGSLKRLFYLSAIEKGKHLHLPRIQYHQTNKVEISTSVPMPAHMDGEYFEADRFLIDCLPKRFSFLW